MTNKYVCITDGDIVYENNCIFDFLLQYIDNNDLLIQSEGIYNNDLCSGFMFIKSNEKTLELFNPINVEKYKNIKGWDDQVYVNEIKYKLKFKKLPLSLFPTGKYYYEYNNVINPYLIHFNWIIGNKKKVKMIEHNKWFQKIKICQNSNDGFGNQLEGILRLISLSINKKAEYQFNYKKRFLFEHSNYDSTKLENYLLESLKYFMQNKKLYNSNKKSYNISSKEQRTFEEILLNDNNFENTIYLYDGVCSNIPEELPPNFEKIEELEKSLPILIEAFVEKNNYLPSTTYNNNRINVCCHIRLGDAIGQRILDNENICKVINYFQKDNKYNVVIHSDGDVNYMENENTIIHDKNTDVLQILSDFIFADILIINYSSLSIAAHLLGNKKQRVICPTKSGESFKHRILNKCITCDDFLQIL